MKYIAIIFALAGCMPPMSLTRATTLAPSEARVGASVELSVLTPEAPPEQKVPAPWAHVGGGYHQGIADGVEAGGRGWIFGIPDLWNFGLAADGKFQLRRSEDPRTGVDVALGASIVYQQVRWGGTPWHQIGAIVPLYIGHNIGDDQFVWGPHVGLHLWTGMGQNPIVLPTAGGSVGYAWRIGRTFDLIPQLDIFFTPVGVGGEVHNMTYNGSWGVQLGVGGSFRR